MAVTIDIDRNDTTPKSRKGSIFLTVLDLVTRYIFYDISIDILNRHRSSTSHVPRHHYPPPTASVHTITITTSPSPSIPLTIPSLLTSPLSQISTNSLPPLSLVHLQLHSLPIFYALNATFLSGPSFAQTHQSALKYFYSIAPQYMQDLYTCVNSAMLWAHRVDTDTNTETDTASAWDDVDVTRGTLCLARLRHARIRSAKEAIPILTLGHAIALFDVLTTCEGAIVILRHTLELVKPWYAALAAEARFTSLTIAPVWWDLVHCLVRRERPVLMRGSAGDDADVVDHCVGFCAMIMPLMGELCVLGAHIRDAGKDGIAGVEDGMERLESIRERTEAWKPSEELLEMAERKFTPEENAAMTAQARMVRLALLLLCHRHIHPLGHSTTSPTSSTIATAADTTAKSRANAIITQLCIYTNLVGPQKTKKKLPHTAFPLFLAMLETTELPGQFWDVFGMRRKRGLPGCGKRFRAAEWVWNERRRVGFEGMLLEVLEGGPWFVVVP